MTSEQLEQLVEILFGKAGGQLYPEPHYALSMCMLKLVENGALRLRVMHTDETRAFLVRPEVIALMRHMSMDVQLQGQAICVSRREAMEALRFGPTADARTKTIISAVLDREAKQGTRLSAKAVMAEVISHPRG